MFDFPPDLEGSETLTSSQSSMSCESYSSFSNFSFDTLETQTIKTPYSSSAPEYYSSVKPHRSSDLAWEVIRSAIFRNKKALNFRDFKLVRQIGSGDIGHVYLCRLKGINNNEDDEKSNYYAMKVVDKEALAVKKKLTRAETEKRILKMLDHPFLPTLYAEFEDSHLSCVVMEYCSGGDLHSLRHKQPGKRFSLNSARFYAAEVLVALEYLHMLGIIYRDLKPENILVRSDGHIMLSDFDLSLCSNAIPVVESPDSSPFNTNSSSSSSSSCTAISLYQKPSTAKSPSLFCFGGNRSFRSRKVRIITTNRQFVAEPVSARSCSFVGTHEYVSPEVASGKSHGNAVDWWAYGIFIYELIYGVTPFAGETNEMTLRNIVKKKLSFPTESPATMSELHARQLISELLVKDPEKRLGVKRGSAEVKTHAFFKGLNFALVRSYPPPGIPSLKAAASSCQDANLKTNQSTGVDFF